MKIQISESARTLLEKRGGVMAIDFIRPIG